MNRKTVTTLVKFVICAIALVYTVYNTPVSSKKSACLEGFVITPDVLQRSAFERIQVLNGECFFPADYESGSRNFVAAATAAGADVSSMPVGTDGLRTDVAIFRTGADPTRFLVHLSGTHGPEGYVGSAIQNAALQYIKANGIYQKAIVDTTTSDSQDVVTVELSGTGDIDPIDPQEVPAAASKQLPPTLVFVHAVNPFGFKHHRRVNEDNVDLNRNFLSPEEWEQVKALDPNYARHIDLKDVINPTSRPFPYIWLNDLYMLALSGYQMLLHGKDTIKTALVSGNYINPTGYSYGGQTYTQSTRNLMHLLLDQLDIPRRAQKLVMIDVHSGLGPSGVDTLLDVGYSPQTVERVFPTEYNVKGEAIGALKSSSGSGVGTVGADSENSAEPAAGVVSDKVAKNTAADAVSKGYEMVKGVIAGNFCNSMLAPNLSSQDKICVTQVPSSAQ